MLYQKFTGDALGRYARRSTADQPLDPQFDAFNVGACEGIFEDVISGAKTDRPGLSEALDHLRSGGSLIV